MRVRDAVAGQNLSSVDARISASVRALMGATEAPPTELAAAMGTTKTTFYRRLKGGFSAADVAALADYFGVEVSDLYTGLGGVLPAIDLRARRDSNSQPSDPKCGPWAVRSLWTKAA